MCLVQPSLHDVFFINIAVSNSANSTQAACKYAWVIRISLAEHNTCELLTEFRWLEEETWQGPLVSGSVMRSKTRAVENFIMTSHLVYIRLGVSCYIWCTNYFNMKSWAANFDKRLHRVYLQKGSLNNRNMPTGLFIIFGSVEISFDWVSPITINNN